MFLSHLEKAKLHTIQNNPYSHFSASKTSFYSWFIWIRIQTRSWDSPALWKSRSFWAKPQLEQVGNWNPQYWLWGCKAKVSPRHGSPHTSERCALLTSCWLQFSNLTFCHQAFPKTAGPVQYPRLLLRVSSPAALEPPAQGVDKRPGGRFAVLKPGGHRRYLEPLNPADARVASPGL